MNGMASVPSVSVLMPVYNGEEYLAEAIESVLSQTFSDLEFVIINDGSTDGTGRILADYEQRDERIRVIHRENRGLAAALNQGLDLARGGYIARMDADDVSHPERLAIQVAYLDSHPEVGLVSADCHLIDPVGVITGGPLLQSPLAGAHVEWELYWGNPIVHPSVVFRATVVRSCGGYPTGFSYYSEDYALWLRMVTVTRIAVLQRTLLYLRKHPGSVTMVASREHINEVIGVAQSALQERVGYDPSESCVLLLRGVGDDNSVLWAEVKGSVDLLVDAFEELAARHSLRGPEAVRIRADLAERLLHLVHLGPDRFHSLLTLTHIARLAPRVVISRKGMRATAKVLGGRPLVGAVRAIRRWRTAQ